MASDRPWPDCGSRTNALLLSLKELRAISHSDRRSDQVDTEKLARYLRLDPNILRPISHRTGEQQEALTLSHFASTDRVWGQHQELRFGDLASTDQFIQLRARSLRCPSALVSVRLAISFFLCESPVNFGPIQLATSGASDVVNSDSICGIDGADENSGMSPSINVG